MNAPSNKPLEESEEVEPKQQRKKKRFVSQVN